MPCNCGKKSKATKWVYENNGSAKTFASEIEARAAQIRAGGGGTIKAA